MCCEDIRRAFAPALHPPIFRPARNQPCSEDLCPKPQQKRMFFMRTPMTTQTGPRQNVHSTRSTRSTRPFPPPLPNSTTPPFHCQTCLATKSTKNTKNLGDSPRPPEFCKSNNQTMKEDELAKVLSDHEAWLSDNSKGKRANLSGADLRGKSETRKPVPQGQRVRHDRAAKGRRREVTKGRGLHQHNLLKTRRFWTAAVTNGAVSPP